MTVKMLRSSILDQMGREYVRTARSQGSTKIGRWFAMFCAMRSFR